MPAPITRWLPSCRPGARERDTDSRSCVERRPPFSGSDDGRYRANSMEYICAWRSRSFRSAGSKPTPVLDSRPPSVNGTHAQRRRARVRVVLAKHGHPHSATLQRDFDSAHRLGRPVPSWPLYWALVRAENRRTRQNCSRILDSFSSSNPPFRSNGGNVAPITGEPDSGLHKRQSSRGANSAKPVLTHGLGFLDQAIDIAHGAAES